MGVAIGLAIIVLIVLLLVLSCWERWRRSRKFGKLIRMLGMPREMNGDFNEMDDYGGRAETWRYQSDSK